MTALQLGARSAASGSPAALDRLLPYVPRQVAHWLADSPDDRHRSLDGSLVFVDVSGFTALSERLARQGRVGAEELTRAIGSCFSRLLAVAYGNGGGLLKFGGDALLLFFQGDDHARRAAGSALGMRRSLQTMGAVDCGGTQVRLRMSVGVHSGRFDFFLVGPHHRELILTGPAVTETVAMEAAAGAGEVLVSPAVARLLPAAVVGPARGRGRLLRREPPGAGWAGQPAAIPVDLDLAPALPTPIRDLVLGGGGDAEHRRVAVGFLRFGGSDRLVSRRPTQAAVELDRLVAHVQDVCDRNGVCLIGSDVAADGGKLILTAGAPASGDHDEDRLVVALHELVNRPGPFAVQAGVHSGAVFAGAIGPAYRRTYTVMGDAVNVAARVMSAAAPGQLLVTAAARDRLRTRFDLRELPAFAVKGKRQPVLAFAVEARGRTVEDGQKPATRLVGRGRELQLLTGQLDRMRRDGGRAVQLVGDAGIGKSRLLQEVVTRAADLRVLTLWCQPYESATPFFPFRQLLRDLMGLHGADAGARLLEVLGARVPALLPWAPLLAVAADVAVPMTPEVAAIDDAFRRARVEDAVVALLGALVPERSIWLVDDAHWMDAASADLLRRLLAGLDERRWLVVIAGREQDSGFQPGSSPVPSVLRLGALDARSCQELVHAMTDATPTQRPLSPHDVAAIVDRSGGNPMFLSELVASAQVTGSVACLPESVEAVVAARVDRLSVRARALLRRLSVLGPACDRWLAERMLEEPLPAADDVVWDELADLVAVDGPTLCFRHAIVRDGTYEALPYSTRRDLHARAGDALEHAAGAASDSGETAALLSVHFFQAGRYVSALRYSCLAAGRAARLHANTEAAELYERALVAARRCPDISVSRLADMYERLGDVYQRLGEITKAADSYRAARRRVADNHLALARLLVKEGTLRQHLGRFRQARRWLSRANHELNACADETVAQLRAKAAIATAAVAKDQGRPAEVIRHCRRAVAEAERAGDRAALAHALLLLDTAEVALGQWHETGHAEQALRLYEELDDLWGQGVVLNNMGGRAYFRGEWRLAAELYDRARNAWARIGDAVNAAIGAVNAGEILSDQGRWDDAEPLFRDALRVWRAAGNRNPSGFALSNLGRLLARQGRYDEARTILEEARSEFEAIGSAARLREVAARTAECLLLQRQAGAALALLTPLLDDASTGAELGPMLSRLTGQAYLQLGNAAAATSHLNASLDAARAAGMDYEVFLTLSALAEVAAPSDRGDLLAEGAAIAGRLGIVRTAEPAAPAGGPDGAVVLPFPRVPTPVRPR